MRYPIDISVRYTAIPTEHYEAIMTIVQVVADTRAHVDEHGTATCMYGCEGEERSSGFEHNQGCLSLKARELVSVWVKK